MFGADNQLIVAIEEMSELQKELTKALRRKINYEHLVEELSDVEIMLEQIKMIFAIDKTELKNYKQAKIDRLKDRIEQRKQDARNASVIPHK